MKTSNFVAALVACLGLPCAEAWAQWGYNGYGYGAPYYSSTIGEGAQRGFADVVRSSGMAALAGGQAAVAGQQAYAQAIVNDRNAVQDYIDTSRMLAEYQASLRDKPTTPEQAYRWAHRDAPRMLNTYEYDPISGQISWPLVLQDPAYVSYREMSQDFFRNRVQSPQKLKFDDFQQMHELTENWLGALRSNIVKYKPNDYIRARKFLESLAAEISKT